MALSRISTNPTGTFRLTNRENATIGGKSFVPARRNTQRAALGDIGNKVTKAADLSKKGLKAEITKPKMTRSTASLALDKVTKKVSPMDVCPEKNAFSCLNVENIDQNDGDNPQLVSAYVNDIYDYMRQLEMEQSVRKHYLEDYEINGRMRGILIDWLVQVHSRFHLLQETLYLTVAIIDRFLQVHEVSKSKLQLVGVTSMLLASKYEEMYAPEIADFVYITDNAYTKSDIRKMECLILRALDFNMGRPLPLHFLRRNSKAGMVDATKHTLAKYLIELTITDYELVQYNPSEIAAAGLCLAIKVLDDAEWSDTLHHYSKYSEEELLPIMRRMAILVAKSENSRLTAIRQKYTSSKFMKISTIPELKCAIIQELSSESS